MQKTEKIQKLKSLKTHHYRRFYAKWTSPLIQRICLHIIAPVKIDFRHFFEYDIFDIRIIKNCTKSTF